MNRRLFIKNAIKDYGEDVFELNPWLVDILDTPEIEIWEPIKRYEGLYEVSNYGRIKSFRASTKYKKKPVIFLKTDTFHPKGYRYVTLIKCGVRKSFAVHRLLALAFIKNPNNLPQVNHENTIKNCNEWWNLKWCTNSENQKHANKNNLHVFCRGEKHCRSKLTEVEVLKVRKMRETGKNSFLKIADKFNISKTNVMAIVNRKIWKHI